jgi:hypothetical protein
MKLKYMTLGLWIVFIAIFVIAAAPTTPTVISPADKAKLFGIQTNLTCSGSTDADSSPFNYTFLKIKETSNESRIRFVSGAGTTNDQSTAPYYMESNCGSSRVGYFNLTFNSDIWVIDTEFKKRDCFNNFTIVIDEPFGKAEKRIFFWDKQEDFSKNLTLDVSDYNDGNEHNITYWLTTSGAGNGAQVEFYWNKTNYTAYGDNADKIVLQNSSSTQYIYSANNLPRALYWGCKACDKDQNCSGYTENRSIYLMNFYNCSSGNRALNITFRNESNSQLINATLSSLASTFSASTSYVYNFSDSTDNNSYTFCLDPEVLEVNQSSEALASTTGFPQRSIIFSDALKGNIQVNKTIYLLDSASGIYTTFQVVDVGNSPIESVTVVGEKLMSGSYVEILGGSTDAAGSITFWNDPDVQHRYTFSKSGYTTQIFTITPTQTSYTITMGDSTTINESNYNLGILYNILPTNLSLNSNTSYNFAFNISSNYWNLSSYGFTLVNSTGQSLATATGGTATGSFVNYTLNTGNNSKILMNYYWVIDGNSLNGTYSWNVRTTYQGNFSLMTFFDDLKNFSHAGLNDFTKALIAIFLIVAVIAGLVIFVGDSNYIEYAVFSAIVLLLWMFEWVDVIAPIGRKYFITTIAGLIFLAYVIQDNVR